PFVAEFFDVLPKNSHTQGMERANRGPFLWGQVVQSVCLASWDQFGDALAHFAGSFVGEGYCQYVPRRNSLLNHVGDSKGNDPCLAGAGSRQDEHRTFDSLNSVPLLRVQRT